MERSILSAKLSAKARVLYNNISIVENNEEFEARPLGWDNNSLIGMLQRAFTTRYYLFKKKEILSEMKYDDIRDIFVIENKNGEYKFNPKRFNFGCRIYSLKISMKKLIILDVTNNRKDIVGEAKFGLSSYSIEFQNYPPQLKEVIKEIATLQIVKKMVWDMINPI